MKLVVTGPLGHIGSRLIHSFRPGQFEKVTLIDNMLTQRYPSLFNLPSGVPFHFVEADICTVDLNAMFAGADAVIHLAAITDAANSFKIQDQVEKVNFEGTRRVAEACAANGCGMFFVSTTSVYGSQDDVVDETCPPDQLKPQSPYADTKLRSEQLLAAMGETHGLRFVAGRFGTIFGISIGMRFHTAVNKFVWQACFGEPVTVWRTAMEQKRPYLDLTDAVAALEFILEKRLFDNRVYNVVTSNHTVGEIVQSIARVVPTLEVKLVDSAIMNQLSYNVLSDRFQAAGFRFQGNLENAVAETARLFHWQRRQAT